MFFYALFTVWPPLSQNVKFLKFFTCGAYWGIMWAVIIIRLKTVWNKHWECIAFSLTSRTSAYLEQSVTCDACLQGEGKNLWYRLFKCGSRKRLSVLALYVLVINNFCKFTFIAAIIKGQIKGNFNLLYDTAMTKTISVVIETWTYFTWSNVCYL
jgi:hypothetical protein